MIKFLRLPRRRYATRNEVALIAARVDAIFTEMARATGAAGLSAPRKPDRPSLRVLPGGKAAAS